MQAAPATAAWLAAELHDEPTPPTYDELTADRGSHDLPTRGEHAADDDGRHGRRRRRGPRGVPARERRHLADAGRARPRGDPQGVGEDDCNTYLPLRGLKVLREAIAAAVRGRPGGRVRPRGRDRRLLRRRRVDAQRAADADRPRRKVLLTNPTYRGMAQRVRLAGGARSSRRWPRDGRWTRTSRIWRPPRGCKVCSSRRRACRSARSSRARRPRRSARRTTTTPGWSSTATPTRWRSTGAGSSARRHSGMRKRRSGRLHVEELRDAGLADRLGARAARGDERDGGRPHLQRHHAERLLPARRGRRAHRPAGLQAEAVESYARGQDALLEAIGRRRRPDRRAGRGRLLLPARRRARPGCARSSSPNGCWPRSRSRSRQCRAGAPTTSGSTWCG